MLNIQSFSSFFLMESHFWITITLFLLLEQRANILQVKVSGSSGSGNFTLFENVHFCAGSYEEFDTHFEKAHIFKWNGRIKYIFLLFRNEHSFESYTVCKKSVLSITDAPGTYRPSYHFSLSRISSDAIL